jgi:hypothetical protein
MAIGSTARNTRLGSGGRSMREDGAARAPRRTTAGLLTVADSAVQVFGGAASRLSTEMHLRNLAGLASFKGLALVGSS